MVSKPKPSYRFLKYIAPSWKRITPCRRHGAVGREVYCINYNVSVIVSYRKSTYPIELCDWFVFDRPMFKNHNSDSELEYISDCWMCQCMDRGEWVVYRESVTDDKKWRYAPLSVQSLHGWSSQWGERECIESRVSVVENKWAELAVEIVAVYGWYGTSGRFGVKFV